MKSLAREKHSSLFVQAFGDEEKRLIKNLIGTKNLRNFFIKFPP
jgi:hypothetical protein